LAVNIAAATPLELVADVVVIVGGVPVNVPLGPVPGAAKVTTAPLTGFWKLSTTVASSSENSVVTVALCGVPCVAVIAAGAPAMFVRLKLAGVAPVAEAASR
jgi:hypothetical protein